jgi:hypothetical protein
MGILRSTYPGFCISRLTETRGWLLGLTKPQGEGFNTLGRWMDMHRKAAARSSSTVSKS